MEVSTEANANLHVGNISETIETCQESYQSSSASKENIEGNEAVVCDYTQEIVANNDKSSEYISQYQDTVLNSYNFEEAKDNREATVDNTDATSSLEAITMTKDNLEENQESANISEMATNNENVVIEEHHPQTSSADLLSDVQSIEQVNENASLSKQVSQERKGSQSSEYSSEYMLEHHTENVYMPEQVPEETNLVSPEQVYSTEIISDDSHDNNSTYDKASEKAVQIENSIAVEETTEKIGDNFVSEYQIEHENEENMNSSLEQVLEKSNDYLHIEENLQETPEKTYKIEYTNPPNDEIERTSNMEPCDANVNEIDNQNVNENAINEISVNDTLIIEESVAEERVVKDRTTEGYVHNVKEEVQPMEVVQHNSVPEKVLEAGAVHQPVEHVEGSEIVENIDEHVALPENIENYTIPDDLEMTVQEGEYTIVEGPSSLEISASRHVEEANSEGTLVLLENYEHSENDSLVPITEEQDEMYMTELRTEAESRQSTSSQPTENKPRRGRKPTYDIPMHVLGHNISKPVESVPNGRALPKPRLGVKVPYRNLTSQIVSKAEIEKEIMDRARIKQEQASSRGDLLFARKLTQRLARKIAPSPDRPKRVTTTIKSKEPETLPKSRENVAEKNVPERIEAEIKPPQSSTIIENDSDLLAILEGEGEEMPVLPKEIPQPQVDESNLKMLEREIALQQLQELPHQTPKQRIFRGRQVKPDTRAPVLIAEASTLSKVKSTEKTVLAANETSTSTIQPSSNKENTTSKQTVISREGPSNSPRREQSNIDVPSPKRQPVEIEPQVKVNMVLKTYSRKRKTVDLPESLAGSPIPKKAMLEESEIKVERSEPAGVTDVYVTKSSRVIKKKVIWDPDEIPSRSPKHMTRSEVPSVKIVPIKSVKSVDKNSNTEKVADKKSTTEKLVKEKPLEKKSNEKLTSKKVSNEKAASPAEKKTLTSKVESPKANKSPIKNKKLRSEVDRLLMDEGAVKMLYDLKNTEETVGRKKKDVYSVDKAHKDLIKKANLIKNDLEQNTSNESPKSLRKKEAALTQSPVKPAQITALTERKMSKDSTRSSVHTPPGSPAYSFPHSQSSMLIRRRSSSSISSSDEVDTTDDSRPSKKKSATSSSSDTPKPKRAKKSEDLKAAIEPETSRKGPVPTPVTAENKLNQYKSFTVKKTNKQVTVDLNYINEKCYCTVQVLEELTAAMTKLSKDKDCSVVSITSSSKAFCLGLDYASLVSAEGEERKSNATELAERVRDFLLCLLNFPKVLVAGIQGECVGLGVTMLPLFDMVIASDTATFSTPYANLGCMAEAGFLLSTPNLTNHGLAAELLFTSQKLTADDAFRRGLISRLCWPEKYNETLKNLLTSLSKGSKQSLEATKKQLRRHTVQTTEAAIKADTKIMVEHWMSPECQKSFARVNENEN